MITLSGRSSPGTIAYFGDSLTDNTSRLASSLRITKTADDSAGANISVRMGSQVSGMAQANQNTQDYLRNVGGDRYEE